MRIRNIFWPLGALFGQLAKLRFMLFSMGLFKRYTVAVPTIVVGNLRVGGTGKTPLISFIAGHLHRLSVTTAILSRGYKRQTKGFILLNKDAQADQVGDEPKMLSLQLPELPIAVCEDRVLGIHSLLNIVKPKPAVIVLDDAFQHHKLKASYYIVTTSYHDLFTNDYPIPHGWLRENRSAASRANLIIVTKCPSSLSEDTKENIRKKCAQYSNAPCIFSSLSYQNPLNLKTLKGEENFFTSVNCIELVTTIANTQPLVEYINSHKINFTHHKFADHHAFKDKELQAIYKRAQAKQSVILCTEKDAVKLPAWFSHGKTPCYVLPISAQFNPTDQAKLFEDIQRMRSNFAAI